MNLVKKYLEKAEDFREYLEQAEVYNQYISIDQVEDMLTKAAEKKEENKMWDYIFKDSLKVRIPVDFEVPFTNIESDDLSIAHGEVNLKNDYPLLVESVFSDIAIANSAIQDSVSDTLREMSYDEDFKKYTQGELCVAKDMVSGFIWQIYSPVRWNLIPELRNAYKAGEDKITFDFDNWGRSINGKFYYPIKYTKDELKEMVSALLKSPLVDKGVRLTTPDLNNEILRYLRENTELCRKLTVLPTHVKVNRCARKLLDNLEVGESVYEKLEQIQNYFSVLKQYTHTKGTLVLSLDPMDFISASDNTYGWKSCFSVQGRGSYNRGCYAAMTAPDICIAYIEGSAPYTFGSVERTCSNKKWRAWVNLSDLYFFVNKGYPFKSEPLTNIIEAEIFRATPQTWLNAKNFNVKAETCFESMYSDVNNNTRVHFNKDKYDTLPITFREGDKEWRKLDIVLGGDIYDPFTRDWYEFDYAEDQGDLWGCLDTYHMGYCCGCGEYYDLDELVENDWGEYLCPSCYGYEQEQEQELEEDEE